MVTQKVRNRDLSYTIFSFRRCGYILAVVSVESFGYVDNLFIRVDICRSECKSFPQTQAGIVEDAEKNVIYWVVHMGYELFKFFPCPEVHLFSLAAPDRAGHAAGVSLQSVVFYRKIQDCI